MVTHSRNANIHNTSSSANTHPVYAGFWTGLKAATSCLLLGAQTLIAHNIGHPFAQIVAPIIEEIAFKLTPPLRVVCVSLEATVAAKVGLFYLPTSFIHAICSTMPLGEALLVHSVWNYYAVARETVQPACYLNMVSDAYEAALNLRSFDPWWMWKSPPAYVNVADVKEAVAVSWQAGLKIATAGYREVGSGAKALGTFAIDFTTLNPKVVRDVRNIVLVVVGVIVAQRVGSTFANMRLYQDVTDPGARARLLVAYGMSERASWLRRVETVLRVAFTSDSAAAAALSMQRADELVVGNSIRAFATPAVALRALNESCREYVQGLVHKRSDRLDSLVHSAALTRQDAEASKVTERETATAALRAIKEILDRNPNPLDQTSHELRVALVNKIMSHPDLVPAAQDMAREAVVHAATTSLFVKPDPRSGPLGGL